MSCKPLTDTRELPSANPPLNTSNTTRLFLSIASATVIATLSALLAADGTSNSSSNPCAYTSLTNDIFAALCVTSKVKHSSFAVTLSTFSVIK